MGSFVRPHYASSLWQLLLGPTGVHVEIPYEQRRARWAFAQPLPQFCVLRCDGSSVLHVGYRDRYGSAWSLYVHCHSSLRHESVCPARRAVVYGPGLARVKPGCDAETRSVGARKEQRPATQRLPYLFDSPRGKQFLQADHVRLGLRFLQEAGHAVTVVEQGYALYVAR